MAHAATAAVPAPAPPLNMGLRINLSVMMFLQFAIWGSWFTVLGNRLAALGLSDYIGSIYGTMALGAVVTPMFIGQVADRYFASERLMALLHLAGAGLLYWLSQIQPVTDPAQARATGALFWWIALGYALVYTPSLALANSIAFTHVPDGGRDFPGIRVLGTIGWIVAGVIVGQGLAHFTPDPKTSNLPLLQAAGLSVVLAVFSLALPHTPPRGQPGDSLPFLRAVGLLKDFSFAVFFGVSFLITIVLAFYYNYTGLFLDKQLHVQDVASTMTIGQVSEMIILPFLPAMLYRFGMKWVLALGMLAWGIRYGIFALGEPYWLVIASLALHGVCFDFFFAAGFIYVDQEAPSDIRGSAQALFTFLTYGVGMWAGSEFSNVVFEWYTKVDGATKVTDWRSFWTLPSVGVLIAFFIFVIFFRIKRKEPIPTPTEKEAAARGIEGR
jgi:nucleoside transporter